MCLVHDNQIKMPGGEQLVPRLVTGIIDAVHHGLVGGKHRTGAGLLLALGEVAQGEVGQLVVKRPLGLRHQCVAVGQKQQILHPAVTDQHIGQ